MIDLVVLLSQWGSWILKRWVTLKERYRLERITRYQYWFFTIRSDTLKVILFSIPRW